MCLLLSSINYHCKVAGAYRKRHNQHDQSTRMSMPTHGGHIIALVKMEAVEKGSTDLHIYQYDSLTFRDWNFHLVDKIILLVIFFRWSVVVGFCLLYSCPIIFKTDSVKSDIVVIELMGDLRVFD